MKKIGILLILISIIIFGYYGLRHTDGKLFENDYSKKEILLDNLVGMSLEDVKEYANKVDIELDIQYQYNSSVDKDLVISQDLEVGTKIFNGDVVGIFVSKGDVPVSIYKEYNVNELGRVPIMMYHGIVDMLDSETEYIGGNVDKDGYNRTVESFRKDLEFYYQNGYRMIRLEDFVDGVVDVELGYSPIILTFDDGNENNFRVLGEENGELVIDPNCAIGILEEFKNKYPDFNVTATFFVNEGLFYQDKYNEKILNWLVSHGYDVGNHTMTHVNFSNVDRKKTEEEVGGLYEVLNKIIFDKYVSIIALPFGSPYNVNHDNYSVILNGEFNGFSYHTKAALRVGWEAEVSVFDKDFDATFLKRIRAYDNNGQDFDIEMNFDILLDKRYISDGDIDTIVIKNVDKDRVISSDKNVILY